MRRAETAAYYILARTDGLKFYHYDVETKRKGLTSCPHDATLFTSSSTAHRHAEQLRKDINAEWATQVGVVQTRTNAPNVLAGG